VRARGGFRVILDGEDRQRPVTQAGDGLVVEIDMGDLDIGRQRVGIDGETVVVRGNFDPASGQVFYGLVAAAVAEF